MNRLFGMLFCGLFLAGIGGCDLAYNSPPVIELVPSDEGGYKVGDDLVLSFSEPVQTDSLSVRIWYAKRDIEGELDVTREPLLDLCGGVEGDCDGAELKVADDRLSATLVLPEEGLGEPDVPMTLEVLSGLLDDAGHPTGISSFFDFQFLPSFEATGNTVSFNEGFFVIGASINEPIQGVNLKLIGEIIADDSGRIAIAMGDADPIGDAPKNTMDPSTLEMDKTDQGYGVHAMGALVEVENGDRFLETEKFAVNIRIDNLQIVLQGLMLSAKIVDMGDEGELLDGTLTYQNLDLINKVDDKLIHSYEGGNPVTFQGRSIPSELVPEGAPTVCDEPCGGLTAQCEPPEEFPEEGMCLAQGE